MSRKKGVVAFALLVLMATINTIVKNDNVSSVFRRLNDDDLSTTPNTFMSKVSSVSDSRRTESENAVIVAVVSKTTNVQDLCDTMKTLVMVEGSDVKIPVMIMHTSDLSRPDSLSSCTDREVLIHSIDLEFPQGFSPEEGVDYYSALIHR